MNNKEAFLKTTLALESIDSILDRLEILANVFLLYGFALMKGEPPNPLTPESVMSAILDDMQQNGETLGNSLARQGIILLSWIEKVK